MAGAAGRALRGPLPRAAARAADLDAAGSPALFPGRRTPTGSCCPGSSPSQHREPRPGRGARRQRARGAPAPVRRRVLLGSRIARRRSRARAAHWTPSPSRRSSARSATRCARRARWRATIAARIGGNEAHGRARRAARQVRPGDEPGRRVPGTAGRHGHATTRAPMASRPRSPRRSPSTTSRAAPAMRCPPTTSGSRRRARRPARHAGRHLRDRPEAHRARRIPSRCVARRSACCA